MAEADAGGEAEAVSGRLRRMLVGERIIALCEPHFARASDARAPSLEALRASFVEDAGRRSLLSRRAPLDRRVFPARPEGRRRSTGRRATDVD